MQLTITIEIGGEMIEKIIRGMMQNFPEASDGSTMRCVSYRYPDNRPLSEWQFEFEDGETGKTYKLGKEELCKAFPLLFSDKWPKGCTQPPRSCHMDDWDNWLCDADAIDFDAFVQLACFGEVIYG